MNLSLSSIMDYVNRIVVFILYLKVFFFIVFLKDE